MTALPQTEILCFDGFDDLDTVAPLEILAAAGFPVTLVRPEGHAPAVRSAHGLPLTIDRALSDAAELVVVPGGGWRDDSPEGVRAQIGRGLPASLGRLHEAGTVIASVCTGAMALAAAGLLTGRPAVTNRIALDDLAAAGAQVRSGARVVDAGSVVTCGGPSAGLDLGIHLVARFAGAAAGERAAARLEYVPAGAVLMAAAA